MALHQRWLAASLSSVRVAPRLTRCGAHVARSGVAVSRLHSARRPWLLHARRACCATRLVPACAAHASATPAVWRGACVPRTCSTHATSGLSARGVATLTLGTGSADGASRGSGGSGSASGSGASSDGPGSYGAGFPGVGLLQSLLPPGVRESLTRACVASTSAVTALLDPQRADAVAALGEATGEIALQKLLERMRADEVGQQLLELKPTITSESIDFDDLGSLPPDSFGHAYYTFMVSRGFTPEGRPPVQHVQDPNLAFVMQRYRQVHDFWHVLAGVPTSVLGELALKWFEMVHTGLPGCAISSFVGPLRLTAAEHRLLLTQYIPWASHAAREAHFLLNVFYEDLLHLPLADVRAQLNFQAAPSVGREQT